MIPCSLFERMTNHKYDVTLKEIATGAKRQTLKIVVPFLLLLQNKASNKAKPICKGTTKTTNIAVFLKEWYIAPFCLNSSTIILKLSNPIKLTSVGLNKSKSVKA